MIPESVVLVLPVALGLFFGYRGARRVPYLLGFDIISRQGLRFDN